MRALVQRVQRAKVTVGGTVTGQIGHGIVILLGITHSDTTREAEHLVHKVIHLRIFSDANSKMNLSLINIAGELLVVPQFTLYGHTQKGTRPSYSEAAPSELARQLFHYFVETCESKGITVRTGAFQAHMMLELVNDGPVTLLCEAKSK